MKQLAGVNLVSSACVKLAVGLETAPKVKERQLTPGILCATFLWPTERVLVGCNSGRIGVQRMQHTAGPAPLVRTTLTDWAPWPTAWLRASEALFFSPWPPGGLGKAVDSILILF